MSAASARNPFPGLRPFGADEAHLFFGRDDEVDAMVDRLAAQHLLAVVGGSGSGKSSLVNCGLRPALHTGRLAAAGTAWRVASCRPGADPIGHLAQALAVPAVLHDAGSPLRGEPALPLAGLVETTLRMSRRGLVDAVEQARLPAGVNLLLVVDQFEELFRYRRLGGAGAADDARAFVELLLQARAQRALPLYVVLTMRSDFLGECSGYDGLAQAISDSQYLVPRMTRDERRAAIAGPVGVAGARLDPVLLTRLVNDVGEDPDQLSILQHALHRTWACWEAQGATGPIALRHYEDPSVGTMANALDRHAEQAWAALPDDASRALCERLLRALTDHATDPRGVRRPARLDTLCAVVQASPAALCAVIDVLRAAGRSFLMPPPPEPLRDATVIDIAHESLMRIWARLRRWADDEARSAQQLRRIADAAALRADGRGGLWRDPELHHALAWERQQRPNAAWAAQYGVALAPVLEFLRASEAERAAGQAAAARRQRRRRQGYAALVLGLAALGGVFLVQWQRTEQLLVAAQASNLRKLVLQSRAMLDGEVATTTDVALLLAAAAFRLGAANEAYGGLQVALQHTPRLQRVLSLPGPVLGFSPDQSTVATLHGNSLQLHDAATGAPRGVALHGHLAPVSALAFSADGRLLATASEDHTLRLWHAADGRPVGAPLRGHGNRVWSVAFSPDGRRLASGGEDATVRLWDVASGAEVGVLRGHEQRVWGLAYSADGRWLASASDDRTVRLWEATTGRPHAAPLQGHTGVVSSVAFSPDSRRLVSAGGDQTLRLWDVATARPLGAPLHGHSSRIWSVDFSPDGRQLASAGEDQTVRLWDADSGQPLGAPLRGHKSRVWRVGFAADGASLLSGSNDRTLMRWHAGAAEPAPLRGHKGPVRTVAVAADGRTAAAGGDDGDLRLWDLATLAPLGVLAGAHAGGVAAVAFSPDGTRLASAGEGGRLRLWSWPGGAPVRAPIVVGGGPTWALAWSPDGRTLATGSGDGAVRRWDAASGRLLGAPSQGHTQRLWSVAFSPDGRRLASAGDDATIRLWDVASGSAVGAPLTGHTQRIWSLAFSPDGQRLASASEDGTVRLWDAASGAPVGPPLRGHLQAVTAVAFGPDGGTLASASDDATLRLWDAHSGEARGGPLRGHAAATVGLAFADGGRRLVSASLDGTLRLWDAPVAWIDRLCAKLVHDLGPEDWRRFVGAVDYVPQCGRPPAGG